jgi:hypothetical protein
MGGATVSGAGGGMLAAGGAACMGGDIATDGASGSLYAQNTA